MREKSKTADYSKVCLFRVKDTPLDVLDKGTTEQCPQSCFSSSAERKMIRLLVLVLVCGALLISTEAQQDYHGLADHFKEAIKHAVKKVHQSTSHHMNFYTQWKDPKIRSDYIDIEILLRATNCAKSAEPDHRDDCVFMTNRPFINCRVCSTRSGNDLTDPSIDCAPQKRVDYGKRQKMCERITGENCLMCVTDLKPEIDCPGCF
nr:uncharacterized protein LOC111837273 [Paramormyrops kingsleyae]